MNDKELAEKIVALLPDFHDWGDRPGQASERYGALNWHLPKIAHDFVRDWRVAGALMEKLAAGRFRSLDMSIVQQGSGSYEVWGFVVEIDCSHYEQFDSMDKSLPRSVIEACVEALDGT